MASWEGKFTEELAEKQEELATLNSALNDTVEQLDLLEQRWKSEEEIAARLALEAAAAAIQAEKDAVIEHFHSAAKVIQQAWRQSQIKRAERAAQKKKKGKGKKSKKKK